MVEQVKVFKSSSVTTVEFDRLLSNKRYFRETGNDRLPDPRFGFFVLASLHYLSSYIFSWKERAIQGLENFAPSSNYDYEGQSKLNMKKNSKQNKPRL